MSDLKQIVLQRKAQAQTNKPKKSRRKSGRRKESLKDRKIKNTIQKTRQRIEAQELELNAPRSTLKQRKELNKIRKQSIEEEHLKSMYERGQDKDTDANEQKRLIIELIKPEGEKKGSPDYTFNTSYIPLSDSNKMLSNARNFNELRRQKYQARRNAVQAELAEMGDYQKMFDADDRATAEAEREAELYPVYPPLVYGKEASNLFRSKFIETPSEKRRPAPSVRRGPRSNAPRRNPRPVTRKVALAPEVPVLRKMPAAPKPQQSRRRRP